MLILKQMKDDTMPNLPKRQALVLMHNRPAGKLTEYPRDHYVFHYLEGYTGPPISLTLPVRNEPYAFHSFPTFFDNLLPEGYMLEMMLRRTKLDKDDYMGQLLLIGHDCVGAVSVVPDSEETADA